MNNGNTPAEEAGGEGDTTMPKVPPNTTRKNAETTEGTVPTLDKIARGRESNGHCKVATVPTDAIDRSPLSSRHGANISQHKGSGP